MIHLPQSLRFRKIPVCRRKFYISFAQVRPKFFHKIFVRFFDNQVLILSFSYVRLFHKFFVSSS